LRRTRGAEDKVTQNAEAVLETMLRDGWLL